MADPEARPGTNSPHSKSAWAATSLRSGFGSQPLSHRTSAPAAGFGSSSRDAYGRQVWVGVVGWSGMVHKSASASAALLNTGIGTVYGAPPEFSPTHPPTHGQYASAEVDRAQVGIAFGWG